MSASREKKTRQDVDSQGPTAQAQNKQKAAKKDLHSTALYTAIIAICAVLAVCMLVWNSGMIQRSAAAVTVNGVKYNAADVQYYYNRVLNQNGLSSAAALKDTVMNEETGETFHDYLLDQSVELLVSTTATADKAEAEGFTLDEEAQAQLDETLEQLKSAWIAAGYPNLKSFVRANYGPYMDYDQLVQLLTREWLASNYAMSVTEGFTYDDADYDAYYKENPDKLDTFTMTQFVLQAKVETKDADGNELEMTDEEKAAALEEAKTAVKAKAEELQSKLNAGEDPAALAETYADDLYSSAVSERRVGEKVNSSYSEWLFDSARKDGDVTLAESENGSTAYNFYVVRFEGRALEQSATSTVRHILVKPEIAGDTATQEEIDAAKAEAQEILDQWKSGEATEDSFATLATEKSADTGSAKNGGLIADIDVDSSYVPTFKDWALDADRKDGDTELVQSDYGWHIMYYVGRGEPTWKLSADEDLRIQGYTEWQDELQKGYEPTKGSGMKYVQA